MKSIVACKFTFSRSAFPCSVGDGARFAAAIRVCIRFADAAGDVEAWNAGAERALAVDAEDFERICIICSFTHLAASATIGVICLYINAFVFAERQIGITLRDAAAIAAHQVLVCTIDAFLAAVRVCILFAGNIDSRCVGLIINVISWGTGCCITLSVILANIVFGFDPPVD